ncbi:MAG: sugar phosphate isomerase/epimerase [Phycisphaera sp.]|nr:MAG: sugar phosphate isomerase/epimerase [Phycisphaera sp.]
MRIGVCSWSLQPGSPDDLARKAGECGLSSVQLALEPLLAGEWDLNETASVLRANGIQILSAMVQTKGEDYTTLNTIRQTGGLRPDEHWETNLALARRAAPMCTKFGIDLVTFHAGFMPHDTADPEFSLIRDRVLEFSQCFHDHGVRVALETGQESAETLRFFLEQLRSDAIGVNFDPANMILYGMGDPADALLLLYKHTYQIHLKDATQAHTPGEWGAETPVGRGHVDWTSLFETVAERHLNVDMCFEREAGDSRVRDISDGLDYLMPLLKSAGAQI